MVVSCCMVNCANRARKGSKQRFYRIPKVITHLGEHMKDLTERRRAKWLSRINRKDWYPTDHDRVCSDHFVSGKPALDYLEIDQGWAPSLKLGYSTACNNGTVVKNRERCERSKARCEKRRRELEYVGQHEVSPPVDDGGEDQDVHNDGGISCQTDMISSDVTKLTDDLDEAKQEIKSLKEQLCYLNESLIVLKHFTGIPDWDVSKHCTT